MLRAQNLESPKSLTYHKLEEPKQAEGDKWGMGWVLVGTAVLGRPDFAPFCGKMLYFPGFWPKSGRPKNGRSYHHPSHPPLVAL